MNSSSGVPSLTGVVKYLIMINAIMFVGTYLLGPVPMSNMLGIHFVKSELFRPHQIVTHMFMHDGLAHLAINMFVLWMFGSTLEMVWGAKRFLIFYLSTGLGAVLLHQLVNAIEI
ncbi:MAG: rhomboid family intramembrane serine protease, partial [Bacteroidota bacterium]